MNDRLAILIESIRVDLRILWRKLSSRPAVPVAALESPHHTNRYGERTRTTSRCAWN